MYANANLFAFHHKMVSKQMMPAVNCRWRSWVFVPDARLVLGLQDAVCSAVFTGHVFSGYDFWRQLVPLDFTWLQCEKVWNLTWSSGHPLVALLTSRWTTVSKRLLISKGVFLFLFDVLIAHNHNNPTTQHPCQWNAQLACWKRRTVCLFSVQMQPARTFLTKQESINQRCPNYGPWNHLRPSRWLIMRGPFLH